MRSAHQYHERRIAGQQLILHAHSMLRAVAGLMVQLAREHARPVAKNSTAEEKVQTATLADGHRSAVHAICQGQPASADRSMGRLIPYCAMGSLFIPLGTPPTLGCVMHAPP